MENLLKEFFFIKLMDVLITVRVNVQSVSFHLMEPF